MASNEPVNQTKPSPESWVLVAIAWILVGIPLVWGIYRTLRTAVKMF